VSSPRRPRQTLVHRAATSLVAGALPLALSACGASLDAQTYQERTQAGATNTAVGTLAVRGLYVLPPEDDRTYEPGDDAVAVVTVVNADDEPDRLLEVTTDAAEEVVVLDDGQPGPLEVQALGTTRDRGQLLLRDLTSGLYEGTYITMTLRFERNGELTVPVPVATSGTADRPIFTGDGEHEPALQAPAGGHHEGEEPGGEGGEQGEGIEEPSAEGEVEDGEGVPENEGEDGDPDGLGEGEDGPAETESEIGADG
jgi:copper(I)-binding protein